MDGGGNGGEAGEWREGEWMEGGLERADQRRFVAVLGRRANGEIWGFGGNL